jgi:predicted nucleic acid-binding protein
MSRRMIYFGTNFLIQTAVAGSSAHERFRAWASAQENLNVSSVAWAEFLCGLLDTTAESIARQISPNPEPLLPADAALSAKLFNQPDAVPEVWLIAWLRRWRYVAT